MPSKMICEFCEGEISPAKVKKGGIKRRPRFCSVSCSSASRKAQGFYQSLSVLGNAAQAAYKREHGEMPGYAHRAEVVARLNRERPRRRKKG